MTDCLSWSCPLPRSLLALQVDARTFRGAAAAPPQMCAALRSLPALRHFVFSMDDLSSLLLPLLQALSGCALTYLALTRCSLGKQAQSGEIMLSRSLEVVELEDNLDLCAADWLPSLASLPRCHCVNLSCSEMAPYDASAWAILFASPALRVLLCDDLDTAAALAERRTSDGLLPVDVSTGVQQEVWGSYRAALRVPAIHLRPLAGVPEPQMDRQSCWTPIVDSLFTS